MLKEMVYVVAKKPSGLSKVYDKNLVNTIDPSQNLVIIASWV